MLLVRRRNRVVRSHCRAYPEPGSKLNRLGGWQKRPAEQGDLWLDLGANEDDLKHRDIQSYRVVHVATHGVLDAMRPQFSGLVLSLVGNKSDDDGFLRTGEVFNLKLGAPLVMLSACESGLGKVKRGEGVIGLSRGVHVRGRDHGRRHSVVGRG